jgi:hypothetical protein
LMALLHHFEARVLAGSDDQPGLESPVRYLKGCVAHLSSSWSAAAHEGDDLDLVAIGEYVLGMPRPADYLCVDLHRDPIGTKSQRLQQDKDRRTMGELPRFAVHYHSHSVQLE